MKVAAGAAMKFSGPTASYTVQAQDGMVYTASGGWKQIPSKDSVARATVTSATRGFGASLTADVTPYLQVDFGISAALSDCGSDLRSTAGSGSRYSATWPVSTRAGRC